MKFQRGGAAALDPAEEGAIMVWLILRLVLFLGMHSAKIVAWDFRQRVIADRGENAWKSIYTLVSLIGFVLIIWGYGNARYEGPILYTPPFWFGHITALLMLFSFIFLVAAYTPAGRIKAAVKHPMLLAIKLWAFGHLLINGELASLLLFGGFLGWAIADRISLRRREAAGLAEPPDSGPWRNDAIPIVVGPIVYVAFVWRLHEWLFGVSPIV